MEDLIFLIVAIIIGMIYNATMNESTSYVEIINDNKSIAYSKVITAEVIKDRLIQVYHSDIVDKREKIVSLLLQLERLEEPDDFFSEYDHIREFIFNTT